MRQPIPPLEKNHAAPSPSTIQNQFAASHSMVLSSCLSVDLLRSRRSRAHHLGHALLHLRHVLHHLRHLSHHLGTPRRRTRAAHHPVHAAHHSGHLLHHSLHLLRHSAHLHHGSAPRASLAHPRSHPTTGPCLRHTDPRHDRP